MLNYGFDSEEYGKIAGIQKKWGEQIIAELDLSGDERICDLGCGDGPLTAKLADMVPSGYVLGIDPSRSMIETASKFRRPNLEFRVCGAGDMDFFEEFDLFFSNSTLHWIKDHEMVWKKVYAGLKPGGVARFKFSGHGTVTHLISAFRIVSAREAFAPFFRDMQWPWYMPETSDYRDFMHTLPFKEIRVWAEPSDQRFESARDLDRFLGQLATISFLPMVPEVKKQVFLDALLEKLEEEAQQKDGSFLETFTRLNVYAKK